MYIHDTAIIDDNVVIGKGTKIWAFSHISNGAKIGNNCIIGEGVHIGINVSIGDGCKIQNGAQLFEGVKIGDNVFIGPCVVTVNDIEPCVVGSWDDRFQETFIENNSSIGANSTILCGITVGENSLVGAGSVVTKSVKNNIVVIGNPAKYLRMVS